MQHDAILRVVENLSKAFSSREGEGGEHGPRVRSLDPLIAAFLFPTRTPSHLSPEHDRVLPVAVNLLKALVWEGVGVYGVRDVAYGRCMALLLEEGNVDG